MIMNYEKKLNKLQRRIEWEFEEFFNEIINSNSLQYVFNCCYEISFFKAFKDYFYADDIDPKLIDLLLQQERPLEFLYDEYQDDDGIHLAYGQEDMENWLQFICERKNK